MWDYTDLIDSTFDFTDRFFHRIEILVGLYDVISQRRGANFFEIGTKHVTNCNSCFDWVMDLDSSLKGDIEGLTIRIRDKDGWWIKVHLDVL